MRKLIFAVLIVMLAGMPAALRAETLLMPVQQAAPAQGSGIDSSRIVAIGAGILIGAALASSALTLRATTVLGAIAGGAIAAWWYERGGVATLEPRKSTL